MTTTEDILGYILYGAFALAIAGFVGSIVISFLRTMKGNISIYLDKDSFEGTPLHTTQSSVMD